MNSGVMEGIYRANYQLYTCSPGYLADFKMVLVRFKAPVGPFSSGFRVSGFRV